MQLRQWQYDCITAAVSKYSTGQNHFLCLATPGAGKTFMASWLAKLLLEKEMIDLVLCFSPSILVSQDFQEALEKQTQMRMDGQLGSKGRSMTYQSMMNLSAKFWTLLKDHRVFVIFDEIHHCSGHSEKTANAWGQKIIQYIQDKAAFTLALTGTPWRSDKTPIVLSRYCQNNRIHCDFTYGLFDAIIDRVCRVPKITLVDNDDIHFAHEENEKRYSSFAQLLTNSDCSYQQLIDNEQLIVYLLRQSVNRLNALRQSDATAGGLIVASSVGHAQKIAWLLQRELGEQALIATYAENDAQQTIQYFRNNNEKWIIAVGMISEGTNIPRLRVCCHLTRIKTELHFRQILGRILRQNGQDGDGFLFVPAEPNLIEYANRISEEVPSPHAVNFEFMAGPKVRQSLSIKSKPELPVTKPKTHIHLHNEQKTVTNVVSVTTSERRTNSLAASYESSINVFGKFKLELISFQTN